MSCLCLLAGILIFLPGCEEQPKKEQTLARVGDAVLTTEQARAGIDTSIASYQSQLKNYVSSWVTSELLYQEALKRGVEQENNFQRDLNNVRKQLAIQSYLRSYVYNGTEQFPDDSVRSYFEQHRGEFEIKEDMFRLNVIEFATREQASSFASRITRGASWENVYASATADPASASGILFVSIGKYFTQRTMMFTELWKVAQTLGEKDVSFPVRTPSGYFIIQALSNIQSGSSPEFEAVKEEARVRMIRETQQQRYDSLISSLRRTVAVELKLPPALQNDTSQQ